MRGLRDPDNRGGFTWQEKHWNRELLQRATELIALRKTHPALRSPHYRRIWPPPADHGVMICVFERRSDDGEELIVAVNAGTERETLSLPLSDFPGHRLALIWGSASVEHGEHNARLSVPPRSAAVWAVK
jgi:pullulanase/glycogen debranching enzyme